MNNKMLGRENIPAVAVGSLVYYAADFVGLSYIVENKRRDFSGVVEALVPDGNGGAFAVINGRAFPCVYVI